MANPSKYFPRDFTERSDFKTEIPSKRASKCGKGRWTLLRDWADGGPQEKMSMWVEMGLASHVHGISQVCSFAATLLVRGRSGQTARYRPNIYQIHCEVALPYAHLLIHKFKDSGPTGPNNYILALRITVCKIKSKEVSRASPSPIPPYHAAVQLPIPYAILRKENNLQTGLCGLNSLWWGHGKLCAKNSVPESACHTEAVLVICEVVLEMILLEFSIVCGEARTIVSKSDLSYTIVS